MRLFLFAFLLLSAALLVSACGDDEGEDSTVDVTLSEWEVVAEPDSVPEGDVTFDVQNDGEEEHELVVVKTDFDPGELPAEDDGSVDEGADGIDVIGETNEIDAGDNDSRTFSLDPGNYVLLCNLVHEEDGEEEAHYQLGMRTPFEVTEAE